MAAVVTNRVRSMGKQTRVPTFPITICIGNWTTCCDPTISGLIVGHKAHKISLYADDILLFLTNLAISTPSLIQKNNEFLKIGS